MRQDRAIVAAQLMLQLVAPCQLSGHRDTAEPWLQEALSELTSLIHHLLRTDSIQFPLESNGFFFYTSP